MGRTTSDNHIKRWDETAPKYNSACRYIMHFTLATIGHIAYTNLLPTSMNGDAYVKATDTEVRWTIGIALAVWMCTVWPAIAYTEYLDTFGSAWFRKLPEPFRGPMKGISEPPASVQLPVVLRNMIASSVFFASGTVVLHQESVRPFVRHGDESIARTLFWVLVYLATADLVFFTGHYAMHKIPSLRKYHDLHHSSLALRGMAGYYMDPIDFFLEHCPSFMSCFVWGIVGPAWGSLLAIGSYNVVMSHSGWDLPFGPDPRQHYLHHVSKASNYGIFLDRIFGTQTAEAQANTFFLDRKSE